MKLGNLKYGYSYHQFGTKLLTSWCTKFLPIHLANTIAQVLTFMERLSIAYNYMYCNHIRVILVTPKNIIWQLNLVLVGVYVTVRSAGNGG